MCSRAGGPPRSHALWDPCAPAVSRREIAGTNPCGAAGSSACEAGLDNTPRPPQPPRGPEQPWLLPAMFPLARSSHESTRATAGEHGIRTQRWCKAHNGLNRGLLSQARPVGSSSFILNQKQSPRSPLPGLLGGSDVPGGQEQVPRAAVAGRSSRSRSPLGAVRKSRRGLTAAASQPERERERLQSHPCVGIAANNGGGRRRARRL